MVSKHYDLDTDVTLGGEQSSDIHIASQKATKTYIDENLKDYAKKDEIPSITGGVTEEKLEEKLEGYVPTTRQINKHPLTGDVTLSTADFVLTGYVDGSTVDDLVSSDTLNQALSKLQAKIKGTSINKVTVGMLAGEDQAVINQLWTEIQSAEKLSKELLTDDINLVSTTAEGEALWDDEQYVLQESVDTYNNAIKTAMNKVYDTKATISDLSQAVKDLQSAETTFRNTVETADYGKKPYIDTSSQ